MTSSVIWRRGPTAIPVAHRQLQLGLGLGQAARLKSNQRERVHVLYELNIDSPRWSNTSSILTFLLRNPLNTLSIILQRGNKTRTYSQIPQPPFLSRFSLNSIRVQKTPPPPILHSGAATARYPHGGRPQQRACEPANLTRIRRSHFCWLPGLFVS